MDINSAVISGFEALTPDLNGIYVDAKKYSLSDWQSLQATLVTASGATSALIPGLHLAGMAADVVFLMNRMATCSYGIGAIAGHGKGFGNILEEEDFAIIMARWAGAEEVSDSVLAKVAAEASATTGKVAAKTLAKFAVKRTSIIVGKKLAGKVGAKVAAKFSAKLGGKLLGGFVPFVGPAIGGGVNLYFVTSLGKTATEWYEFKIAHGC